MALNFQQLRAGSAVNHLAVICKARPPLGPDQHATMVGIVQASARVATAVEPNEFQTSEGE